MFRRMQRAAAFGAIVAMLVPAAIGVGTSAVGASVPTGPYWSGNTYTGTSTDDPAHPPTGGSVQPDTDLNRVEQAVTVAATFDAAANAYTAALQECDHDALNCTTLGTGTIQSSGVLSADVNVADCGDPLGCTVKSYPPVDADDVMIVPIYFAAPLVTSITDTPDPVTAGLDVQYTLSVHNGDASSATGVHVQVTLPSGTSAVSSTPSGSCTLTAPIDCTIGTIAAGGDGSVQLLVQSPSPAPGSGHITITATATPGSNNVASEDTAVVDPTPGTASGYVPPGGNIDTGGTDPANVALPNTGTGAPVTITQIPSGNTFCNGPCNGTASFISDFPGYSDSHHPIALKLAFRDHGVFPTLIDYFTSTIYKVRDNETVGVAIPDCKDDPTWNRAQKAAAKFRRKFRIGTLSGIANPAPCVDARTIERVSGNDYVVTFTILYLSDDGGWARR